MKFLGRQHYGKKAKQYLNIEAGLQGGVTSTHSSQIF